MHCPGELLESYDGCGGQGCGRWNHMEAARAGHVHCLECLREEGKFLELHSPDRASSGEARRWQSRDAAVAACRASHAQALSCLFAGGWPASMDIELRRDPLALARHCRSAARADCALPHRRNPRAGQPGPPHGAHQGAAPVCGAELHTRMPGGPSGRGQPVPMDLPAGPPGEEGVLSSTGGRPKIPVRL